MTTPPARRYEFDDTQNATFARLAAVMMFVAAAMLILSMIVGSAAIVVARSTWAGAAILTPLGIALAVMGAQLFGAAKRFRRIVATRGNDIDNLMTALNEIALAFRVQRWLWITVTVVIVVALVTTIVGSG